MRSHTTLTHAWIWNAIDVLARHHALSTSGLARLAGLDATTFNPSKRFTAKGRPRWPSTESLSRILTATDMSLEAFVALASDAERARLAPGPEHVPLVAQIIDERLVGWSGHGLSSGVDLDGPSRRAIGSGAPFAVEVADRSLEPVYRRGSTLVAASNAMAEPGDWVLIQWLGRPPVARLLLAKNARQLVLRAIGGNGAPFTLDGAHALWMARVIWAST